LLINTDIDLESVKFGKKIELKYIPFSELAIPWNVCLESVKQNDNGNAKASRTLKKADLTALKSSIAQYGLLKPFEVAEMPERLDFFFGKGKYLVIDGQRRYFAIRDLLKLPTEDEEKKETDSLRTNCQHEHVVRGEMQAQKRFGKLSIRNHLLIPCLVYPYTTHLQMLRHSTESKRFGDKPSKEELELAAAMGAEGISDLNSDDLRGLWRVRSRIEEEKRSIEETLKEIRRRVE
jgi:hypothetical protein